MNKPAMAPALLHIENSRSPKNLRRLAAAVCVLRSLKPRAPHLQHKCVTPPLSTRQSHTCSKAPPNTARTHTPHLSLSHRNRGNPMNTRINKLHTASARAPGTGPQIALACAKGVISRSPLIVSISPRPRSRESVNKGPVQGARARSSARALRSMRS